tara:strand:+ start:14784 stop:15161 length:378 start_codon:yes stop_codon:yes gene_type:complete
MALLSGLIGPVTELVGGVIKNRQEIGKAKQTAKLEQIKSGAEWESKMAAASGASWKDEFWTVVLAVPVFMVGYAIAMNDTSVIERVELGFEALNSLPEWYQYLLFLAVSASFGIRGVDKLMSLRK